MKKHGYVIVAAAIGLIAIAALLIRQKASAQILVPVQRAENGLVPVPPRFVEMKLDENTTILVETLDAIPVAIEKRADAAVQPAEREYKSMMMSQLRPLVSGIVDSVKGSPIKGGPVGRFSLEPDEINVEFGVGVSLATGRPLLVLINLSGQASLKVSVTWRKEKN